MSKNKMKSQENARWKGQISSDREKRRHQKLMAILSDSARAFIDRGYYKTSLDDIAAMQNVTKPTLYYYIKNKQDILVKCEEVADRRINRLVDEVVAKETSGYEQLRDFVDGYVAIITDDIIRCHIRYRGQMEDPKAREASLEVHRNIEYRVRDIIAKGIEDGSIDSPNATTTSLLLFSALNGISGWFRDEGPVDQDELIAQVQALIGQGLKK